MDTVNLSEMWESTDESFSYFKTQKKYKGATAVITSNLAWNINVIA